MKARKHDYPVKAIYNPNTGKIEYNPVHSMKGDVVKKLKINRVGGYMNVYTDEKDRDLHHEFFDKNTDFMDEFGWSMVGKPILINHGMDEAFKSMHVGVFDFETEDEVGRYVEGRLFEQEEYEQMLSKYSQRKGLNWSPEEIKRRANLAYKTVQAFFSTGKAHWSSGALPQEVEVNPDNGHVERWPRIEGSATLTPAEPDGTEISAKSLEPDFENSLKAAFELLDAVLNEHLSLPAQPVRDAQHIEQHADKSVTQQDNSESTPSKGKNNMDAMAFLNQLATMLAEFIAGAGEQPEAAVAMADEVVDEMKAEAEALPEEEKAKAMDEELVKAWMGKAIAKTEAKLAKKQALATVAKSEAQKALDAWKAKQPVSEEAARGLPRYTGGNGRVTDIVERSPYANWKPEDYAFAVALEQMTRGTNKHFNFKADNRFMQEMADKAQRAYQSGNLVLDAKAVKGIHAIKANELDHSTQTSFGDEWVPTLWSDNIWEKPRLDNVVAELFDNVEMPSNPYEYPIETTDPTLYFVPETTAETELTLDSSSAVIPDSKVGTGKVTFTAKKLALRVGISAELEEDGIARLIPKFREQADRAVQDGIDSLLLNGDTATTGNINSDGETITATTRVYQAQNALIKQALVTASTNALSAAGNAPTLAHLRQLRGLLGNAYRRPSELAYVCDPSTYLKLLSIDAVVTVDKYGANATILNGELGKIDGIPVFQSNEMALADTDGKVTQTANVTDTGRLLLVHRPSWLLGYRRRISQSMTFLPYFDAWQMVMTVRLAFVGRTQGASDDSVSILYNIAV